LAYQESAREIAKEFGAILIPYQKIFDNAQRMPLVPIGLRTAYIHACWGTNDGLSLDGLHQVIKKKSGYFIEIRSFF
jgi:hypothetical protein